MRNTEMPKYQYQYQTSNKTFLYPKDPKGEFLVRKYSGAQLQSSLFFIKGVVEAFLWVINFESHHCPL